MWFTIEQGHVYRYILVLRQIGKPPLVIKMADDIETLLKEKRRLEIAYG